LSRLRILHVTPTYAPCVGGAERKLRAISERLVARGHEVTVFAVNAANHRELMSPAGGSLPPRETLNGVAVHRFPPENLATRALRAWSNVPGGWYTASLLLREGLPMMRRRPGPLPMLRAVSRAEVDIVTSVNWVFAPGYAGHLARRRRRFALVGVPIFHVARPWALSDVFPPMLAGCDAVFANTKVEEEFILARGARRVMVTGTGVAPEDFTHPDGRGIRARMGPGDHPVVGFIGRQDRNKGALTLLESMRHVWRTGLEARLLFAGQSAHRARDLEEQVGMLPAEQRARVAFHDDFADDEIAHITDACDIVVMPSVEEGFGMAYLEGWMCGKPVIGGRIPSTRCVIDDGVDGLLVEPFDAEELSRAIVRLLSDPALRARMGAAGRAKTLACHTWDAVTDRWEEAFRQVTAAST
jgi:glycosyltransferase involved in cell wall biosynthesis